VSTLLFLAGIALVALGVLDQLKTVVNAEGAGGFVTSRLVDRIWRLALAVHRRRESHRLLRGVGVAMVPVTILTWVAMLWAGWFLIFMATPEAVVEASSGEPASGWSRLYYAGDTIFTLGSGDLRPEGSFWRVVSTVAVLVGLSLVTLGLTYLVPVVQAVSAKRKTAALISALGGTPELLLERSWTGEDYSGLNEHLVVLTVDLAGVRQSYFAYPTLHYFHSLDAHDAFEPRLAALDEALTVLTAAVPPELAPKPSIIEPARHIIRSLLEALDTSFIDAAADPPPRLELDALGARGLPFVDPGAVAAALEDHAVRRRLLRGFVEHDGWDWAQAVWMEGELTGGAELALDPSEHMVSRTEPRP
jgi:hypothetical protein